ncbi:14501_t:CDS:2 [Ambispora leptoticha]|uniref:Protein AF-9 homolog n=1 Tax=Ambispora leptoticha TaxID=144679 RepID=A0A9N8ZS95_9GLOM|nr:14501_t:CDS:2 [Ambispora leptoticha]
MRRWLFHYEIRNTIIRLISLQAINWVVTALVASHLGSDEPLRTWIIVVLVFAIANPIQWLFTSPAKYKKKVVDLETNKALAWKDVARYIIVPFMIVTFITMICLLEQQTAFRCTSHSDHHKLNTNLTLGDTDAYVKVIMVILSSWTENSYAKRQAFRNSTLRLLPQHSNRISIVYRFILGDAPSTKTRMELGHRIHVESQEFNDILMIPTLDTFHQLSRKVYKTYQWSSKFAFDYLIKTDDDVFIRLDTVAKELEEMGPGKRYYWKGLAYWNIPPNSEIEQKYADEEYDLPIFPPFTAGPLYILSRDIISLIVNDAPRLFTRNEYQSLGVWLFSYNIKPIHDRRIQQADVCEDDMIAKQFNELYSSSKTMEDMYENIRNNRRLCEGFPQINCAGVTIVRPIIYGNIATPLPPKKSAETDHTHKWTVSVKGVNGEDISYFIKKVVFKLHETYQNPLRTVESPPFEISETGWGEFELTMKLHFIPESGEKPVTLYHNLRLHPYEDDGSILTSNKGKPVSSFQYDELVFTDPTETMYQILLSNTTSNLPTRSTASQPYSIQAEQEEIKAIEAAYRQVQESITKYKQRMENANKEMTQVKAELDSLMKS